MIGALITGGIVYIVFTLIQKYFEKQAKELKEKQEKIDKNENTDNIESK